MNHLGAGAPFIGDVRPPLAGGRDHTYRSGLSQERDITISKEVIV